MSKTTPAILQIPELADQPGLVHGFSTNALGSVGLTHSPDPAAVFGARREFARVLGVDHTRITAAGAVHGAAVARVDRPVRAIDGVDALVTGTRGAGLFATFADCYPIVLWDPQKRVAGLVHAGWRGTLAGVGRAAAEFMRTEFACRHIRAGIGPGICGSCYEVGLEVASKFDAALVRLSADRFLLDLAAANRAQLESAGVEQIYDLRMCTKESDFLPSHRRNPDGTRFGAIVALR